MNVVFDSSFVEIVELLNDLHIVGLCKLKFHL